MDSRLGVQLSICHFSSHDESLPHLISVDSSALYRCFNDDDDGFHLFLPF